MNIKKISIIFILIVLYDISITYYGINYYGLSEQNPFMRDLVYNNYILISFIKILVSLICLGVAYITIVKLNIKNSYINYLPFIVIFVIQIIFNINNSLLVLGWIN